MKIAFFSPVPYSKKLGATKNRIELAESLQKLGWEAFLIGYDELGLDNKKMDALVYSEALKNYLIRQAHLYDVVLYEYDTLPFDRKQFSPTTLFIARPALLHFDYEKIGIPLNIKAKLAGFYQLLLKLLGDKKYFNKEERNNRRIKSLKECDIIQVQNQSDLQSLVRKGFKKEKIIVVPNGISEERIKLFESVEHSYATPFTIAFVGTFDFRKGAMDFPHILSTVIKEFPNCKFKFLGTKGLFTTEQQVMSFFPKRLRSNISVMPVFEPKDLPSLLTDCQVGVFPSYFESFGFGALEMMAAGLPVVAYNASGPADFIIKELLVPVGDKKQLVQKVLNLLHDPVLLESKSKEARIISREYNWNRVALEASTTYKLKLQHVLKKAVT